MDREYMLQMIRARIVTLKEWYKNAVNGKDRSGTKEVKNSIAAAWRATYKRELQILSLLEVLVIYSKDGMFIDDPYIIEGFDKLVEPINRHYKEG